MKFVFALWMLCSEDGESIKQRTPMELAAGHCIVGWLGMIATDMTACTEKKGAGGCGS